MDKQTLRLIMTDDMGTPVMGDPFIPASSEPSGFLQTI